MGTKLPITIRIFSLPDSAVVCRPSGRSFLDRVAMKVSGSCDSPLDSHQLISHFTTACDRGTVRIGLTADAVFVGVVDNGKVLPQERQ